MPLSVLDHARSRAASDVVTEGIFHGSALFLELSPKRSSASFRTIFGNVIMALITATNSAFSPHIQMG